MAEFAGDLEDSDEEMLMMFEAVMGRRPTFREREDNLRKWSDEEFLVRFKLTKATVLNLLHLLEDELDYPTDRNKCLDPINQLLLTLRYYATGCMLVSVGDFCGVHKSTASRVIRKVSMAIANLGKTFIKMPYTLEERRRNHWEFYNIARFPTVLAVIDCTHIKILSPGGNQAETFRNRKGFFSLNVQTLSDAKLRIVDIVARWPGSTHDQTIFNASRVKAELEMNTFPESVILGDPGYGISKYLMTPIRNPILPAEQLFNESLVRTRNVVERQYGVWKRRFPVLSLGIRLALDTAMAVIVACAGLHNIAIDNKEEVPPHDPDVPDLDLTDDEMSNVVKMNELNGRGY